MKLTLLIFALLALTFISYGQPTVTTTSATNIMPDYATSGGNVTVGTGVTSRGVCWGTSSNPTISKTYATSGSGTGVFVTTITGLSAGTTYHYRAFATNSAGTGYGSDLTFTTGGNSRKGHTAGNAQLNSDQVLWKSFEADSEAIRVDIGGATLSATISPPTGGFATNTKLDSAVTQFKTRLDSLNVVNISKVDSAKTDTVTGSVLHTFTVPTVSHWYTYTVLADSAIYLSNKSGTFTSMSFQLPAGVPFTSTQKDATVFPAIYYQKVSGLAGDAKVRIKVEGR
jgi:hypothetical protein